MEVTRKNFKEALPLVAASIDKADFLAIDAEFTGLINGRDVSMFDTPEEYYETLLNGSTEFLLIQFGLCAFYWNEKEKHYTNDAYNFYLFPRGRPGPERMFLCQSSSLDFLATQGFDFNKLIREGISYMTEPAETRCREHLTERQKLYSNSFDIINIPEENKQQIENICKKVREFLDEDKSPEMEIDRCNAFIRRLLFQEISIRFKNEAFAETKVLDNQNRVLKVTRITSETDGKSKDAKKKEKEWEELEEAVGFSKVARMISQSEKLVVGHNMLLDVIHTLNHFFQPLPPDYASFKEFAHCMFPSLLDTKYMSSLPPFKDKVNSSVLPHLLATLSETPFALPKTESLEGRGYTQTDDKYHEAGYDAYITGLCFLAMHGHLSSMRGEPHARVVASHSAVKPFLNKLFLAKTAYQDSPYINLSGADPTPSRDHVFHLTFPKEWQRNDLNQLFSPFGPIVVNFLDETSALIALSRREQSRDVARTLTGHARVRLTPYTRYKTSKEDVCRVATTKMPRIPGPKSDTSRQAFSSDWRLPEKVNRTRTNSGSTPNPNKHVKERSRCNSDSIDEKSGRIRTNSGNLSPEKSKSIMSPSNLPEKGERPRSTSFSSQEQVDRPRSTSFNSQKEEVGEKVDRPRSNSTCAPLAATPSRKRTSSGLFQIEEAEPPPKKAGTRSVNTSTNNGHIDPEGKPRDKGKEKERTIARFDNGDDKNKCVTAFKESDSWD